MLPNEACNWIRKNIPESKLKETKKFLAQYDNFFNVKRLGLIERVYRATKNSKKIAYSYVESINFLRYLIFLLSDKKAPDTINMESELVRLVGKGSEFTIPSPQ